jgi:retinol-binding protein 3
MRLCLSYHSLMFHALILAITTVTLTPAQVDSIMTNAEKAFKTYVFPDVAEKAVAMLRAHTASYEEISDPKELRSTVNRDLLTVTHDKHVSLWYPFDPRTQGNDQADKAAEHQGELLDNFGFASVRRLPGNVGYVEFNYFSGDPSVGQTIQAAMSFLANTDALIIDLRRNGGGDPIAAEALEGYFFDSQQPITSLMWRDPKTGTTREMQQYTAPTVPGPLYLKKPVYVLTSSRTFSCAEQFVYDLHNLKRITIVGETTGGGANPGEAHDVGNSFAIFIPEGRAYSPVTKTNWEGTGIAPDTAVPAKDALAKAYAMALGYVKGHDSNADVQDEIAQALNDPEKALAATP